MHKIPLWVAAIMVTALTSTAQTTPPPSIGLHGGLNLNFHSPSFPTPNPAPPLPTFGSGSMGLGGALGLAFSYPLSTDIALGARVAYNNLSGKLESTTGIKDTRDASIAHLEISPVFQWSNAISNNLYLLAGVEIGVPLKTTYTQTIDTNGVTSTPVNNGGISDALSRVALLAGLGYDINLNGFHIQPEATFRFPFTKVSSSAAFDTWNIPQARIGVNLMFDLGSSTKEEKKEADLTTPFVEPVLRRVIAFTPQGDTTDVRQVKVEDIQYSELYPLVPYVFFAKEGKKTDSLLILPTKRETGDVPDGYTTLKDAMSVNYSILDVVCARMKKYENAKLSIIGTNDGKTEIKSKTLAKERADQVRDYLVNCGISADRLSTSARDLPEKASSSNVPEGQAENRRVELRSDTPEILEPVVSKQELERIAEPDLLEFLPEAKTSDPITSWRLELSQAGRPLREISGLGNIKPMRWAIRPSELSDKQVPIDYVYTVENSRGAKKTYTGSLPVDYLSSLRKKQEKLADRTVDKFSLILFDFDSDVLTPDNQRILEQKVLSAVKYNSVVKIIGYTDRIGDDKYNKQLSLRRANAVMEALKAKMPGVKFEAYGLGETKELFDNEQALGRQLSRTVQIMVETPR